MQVNIFVTWDGEKRRLLKLLLHHTNKGDFSLIICH